MRNNKEYWILLVGMVTLLAGVVSGCGQPGYATYTNDAGGYTFSYPQNWKAEVSKDNMIYVIKSPTGFASIRIDVLSGLSAQDAAQRWVVAMGTGNADFALLENKAMEGFWNWYVSYDYDAGTGPFHGEAFFKSSADHTYKLDTAGDAVGYAGYPFQSIISSFKLN